MHVRVGNRCVNRLGKVLIGAVVVSASVVLPSASRAEASAAATGSVVGAVDTVSETAGTFVVYGWVWAPSGPEPVFVEADIDGVRVGAQTQNYSDRPDVAAAYPGAPLATGFRIVLDGEGPRSGTVCVRAIDSFGNPLGD